MFRRVRALRDSRGEGSSRVRERGEVRARRGRRLLHRGNAGAGTAVPGDGEEPLAFREEGNRRTRENPLAREMGENGSSLRGRRGAFRDRASSRRFRGGAILRRDGGGGGKRRDRREASSDRLPRGGLHGEAGTDERAGSDSRPVFPGRGASRESGVFRRPREFRSGVLPFHPEILRENPLGAGDPGVLRVPRRRKHRSGRAENTARGGRRGAYRGGDRAAASGRAGAPPLSGNRVVRSVFPGGKKLPAGLRARRPDGRPSRGA